MLGCIRDVRDHSSIRNLQAQYGSFQKSGATEYGPRISHLRAPKQHRTLPWRKYGEPTKRGMNFWWLKVPSSGEPASSSGTPLVSCQAIGLFVRLHCAAYRGGGRAFLGIHVKIEVDIDMSYICICIRIYIYIYSIYTDIYTVQQCVWLDR